MSAKPFQTRKQLAAAISEKLFPVSPRQLSSWPELTVRYVGRVALLDPDETMNAAKKRLDNAPVVKQANHKSSGSMINNIKALDYSNNAQ